MKHIIRTLMILLLCVFAINSALAAPCQCPKCDKACAKGGECACPKCGKACPKDAKAPCCAAKVPGISICPMGILLKDGKPFRGIGVNYYSCFGRKLDNPSDTSYREGFKVLAGYKIPFVRFMAGGYTAGQFNLYRKDKEAYFRLMDDVVKAAEENHVGLIPSLFWSPSTISDIAGEHIDQWGNPKSKTHAFMRQYVTDIVTRYKNSPAIWGWEMGNEYCLYADLPNRAEARPPVDRTAGSRWFRFRTKRDDLTQKMLTTAFVEFATAVRKIDPQHLVVTGNSLPRPFAYNNTLSDAWIKDTRNQFITALLRDNPDPMNGISVHLYAMDDPDFAAEGESRFADTPSNFEATLAVVQDAARLVRKPVFVGEFGGPNDLGNDKTLKKVHDATAKMIHAIELNKIALGAIWVYEFGAQDDSWNITPKNNRGYMLDMIAEANARIQNELGQGK